MCYFGIFLCSILTYTLHVAANYSLSSTPLHKRRNGLGTPLPVNVAVMNAII